MAIYLPGTVDEEQIALDELTPREIVAELDKHVVGQNAAKRAVAIALRNRMRRQKLAPDLAEEVIPKNIIMIGPTGVGKTEIARRLAKLANSPFMKVEASKFTEVGYVGRDVESMIRDLVEIAIDMVREEKLEDVSDKAELNAEERLLDILLPPVSPPRSGESASGGVVLEGSTGLSESSKPHPRETAPATTRRQARRSHGRDRRARAQFPVFRNHLQPGCGGDGRQHQGHAAEHLWPAHQEAEDEGQRSVRVSDSGRRATSDRYGPGDAHRH